MGDSVEYYGSEQLIAEIRRRPALYDKNLKDYGDKSVKDKLWREVCIALIPSWYTLSNEVKAKTGRDIQRKWKNIRDCFRKEINQQRKEKDGQSREKRRKYVFFDQLLFLLPTLTEKMLAQTAGGEEATDEEFFSTLESVAPPNGVETVEGGGEEERRPREANGNGGDRQRIHDATDIDEDRYFLLSLLPAFRRLSFDQKLDAKIEFLQIVRNLAASRRFEQPTYLDMERQMFNFRRPEQEIVVVKKEIDDQ